MVGQIWGEGIEAVRNSRPTLKQGERDSPLLFRPSYRSDGEHPASPHHLLFLSGEAVLLAVATATSLLFKNHPGPIAGDVGIEKGIQSALLPHGWLVPPLEAVSTLNWPVPAAVTLGIVIIAFLVLRRWLDALVVLVAAGIADESTYIVSQYVKRPRPSGNGIHILTVIKNTFSYPSGHVVYATAVFGLLLYLTTQIRRELHPALVWTARVVLLIFIVSMGPSRILEGEHWPSDVFAGFAFGAFWLVLSAHAYKWARHRFPRLLAADER